MVDGHDLFDGGRPLDAADPARRLHLYAPGQGQVLVQGVHHQRAFSRAGHARDAGQAAQGDAAVQVLQVVGPDPAQGQMAGGRAARFGPPDDQVAAQKLAGQG
jgi:hypothetical protein